MSQVLQDISSCLVHYDADDEVASDIALTIN